MISHAEAQALTSARLDGPLDPVAERELVAHLATCAVCRDFAQQSNALAQGLRAMPYLPASPTVSRAVLAHINKPRSPLSRFSGMQAMPAFSAVAAALLVVLVAAFVYSRADRTGTPLDRDGDDPPQTEISEMLSAPSSTVTLDATEPPVGGNETEDEAPTDEPADPTHADEQPTDEPAQTDAAEAQPTEEAGGAQPTEEAATEPTSDAADTGLAGATETPGEVAADGGEESQGQQVDDTSDGAEPTEGESEDAAGADVDEQRSAPTQEPEATESGEEQEQGGETAESEATEPTAEPTEEVQAADAPTETPGTSMFIISASPTPSETQEPTSEPTQTPEPTVEPTETPEPTVEPTETPVPPTSTPTEEPTETPVPPTATTEPTEEPTPTSTDEPTAEPTETPVPPTATSEPTETPEPTAEPTETPEPTAEPTETPEPTEEPTEEPTSTPTEEPTQTPEPTATATEEPTSTPTEEPTATPTDEPTEEPTAEATDTPAILPADGTVESSDDDLSGQDEVTPTETEPDVIEEPTETPEATETPEPTVGEGIIEPIEGDPEEADEATEEPVVEETPLPTEGSDNQIIDPVDGTDDSGAEPTIDESADDGDDVDGQDDSTEGETPTEEPASPATIEDEGSGGDNQLPESEDIGASGEINLSEVSVSGEFDNVEGDPNARLALDEDEQVVLDPDPDRIFFSRSDGLDLDVTGTENGQVIQVCNGNGECVTSDPGDQDNPDPRAGNGGGEVYDTAIGWYGNVVIYERIEGDTVSYRSVEVDPDSLELFNDQELISGDGTIQSTQNGAYYGNGGVLVPALNRWVYLSVNGDSQVLGENPYQDIRMVRTGHPNGQITYIGDGQLVMADVTDPGIAQARCGVVPVDYDLAPGGDLFVISIGSAIQVVDFNCNVLASYNADNGVGVGSVLWLNQGIAYVDLATGNVELIPIDALP